MPVVTREQLADLLTTVNHATFVTFTAKTDADCRAKDQNKTPNPHPRPIWKTNRVNGMLCFWYDEAVLRRLEKEGKSADCFKQGTSWHVPVLCNGRLTGLCQSKSAENKKLYVRFLYRNTCGEPTFTDNNQNSLTKEQVAPFLPKRNNYQNQGTDDPVVILTYALDSITEITLHGETYLVS